MKKVMLYIDTTQREKVIVRVTVDDNEFVKEEESTSRKNQALLPLIVSLLKEQELTLQDLTEITVNPGPGSFTGVRVGVAVANALSYVLQIPVNGKISSDGTSLVEPVYGV